MPLNVGQGFDNVIAVAAADYTSSGDSGALAGYGAATAIRAHVIWTARGGTNPTLDAVIEDSFDGTNWANLGSFTQMTAASGIQALSIISPTGPYLRFRYTIGGTASPHFTFGAYLLVK